MINSSKCEKALEKLHPSATSSRLSCAYTVMFEEFPIWNGKVFLPVHPNPHPFPVAAPSDGAIKVSPTDCTEWLAAGRENTELKAFRKFRQYLATETYGEMRYFLTRTVFPLKTCEIWKVFYFLFIIWSAACLFAIQFHFFAEGVFVCFKRINNMNGNKNAPIITEIIRFSKRSL